MALGVRIMGLQEVDKWVLTLDRTEWKLEGVQVNILMLAVAYRGVAVSLLWKVFLDHLNRCFLLFLQLRSFVKLIQFPQRTIQRRIDGVGAAQPVVYQLGVGHGINTGCHKGVVEYFVQFFHLRQHPAEFGVKLNEPGKVGGGEGTGHYVFMLHASFFRGLRISEAAWSHLALALPLFHGEAHLEGLQLHFKLLKS